MCTHKWRSQRLADVRGKENYNSHQSLKKKKRRKKEDSFDLKVEGGREKKNRREEESLQIWKERRDVGGGCHEYGKMRIWGGRQ